MYGRGQGLAYVLRCLEKNTEIIAYIDNFSRIAVSSDGKDIIKEDDIQGDYDYIVITLMQYHRVKESLIDKGISIDRIICFFDENDVENVLYGNVFDMYKWKIELLWRYNREYVEPFLNNSYFEINADKLLASNDIPQIMDVESTIDEVIQRKKSLVRFGDGEFEAIRKQPRMRFQNINNSLSQRLKEILQSDNGNMVLSIADNYGDLSSYTDEAAAAIRRYLTPNVRRDHIRLLDLKRVYGNAYLTRPYYMYRDKNHEKIRGKFEHLKRIWDSENVLIIEGRHTRFGVGNDLLDCTESIVRLLVPDKNAFDVYDEILANAEAYSKNRLTLCIIGPTATVLSYDLTKKGNRAIDIGQVDTEYEWFLRGAPDRCDVPYKTVSEYVNKDVFEDLKGDMEDKYKKEIVGIIGN